MHSDFIRRQVESVLKREGFEIHQARAGADKAVAHYEGAGGHGKGQVMAACLSAGRSEAKRVR